MLFMSKSRSADEKTMELAITQRRPMRRTAVALDVLMAVLCLAMGFWPVALAAVGLAVADWRRGPA
jgi:hypothetical protein